MAKRIYRAVTKATGRQWFYETKTVFNRRLFKHVNSPGPWFGSLKEARASAEAQGWFRYIDEGPMAYCTVDQVEHRA